eukprot:gb/GECG01001472.1/.p1 GENE.gb/GECG01001472.1/~~gb/GECG01001472.1/.p1  ORF type:complete len:795 (+),score=162.44 gb/GECG01001472.1/:1-2385(+)
MESIYSFFGMSSSSSGAAAAPSDHETTTHTASADNPDMEEAGEWQEVTTSSSSRRKKRNQQRKKKKKQQESRANSAQSDHHHGQGDDDIDGSDDEDDIDSLLVFGGHTNTVKKASEESGILAAAHQSGDSPYANTEASRAVPTRSIGAEGTKQSLRTERKKQEQEKRQTKRREKAHTSLKLTMNGLMAAQDAHASKTKKKLISPIDTSVKTQKETGSSASTEGEEGERKEYSKSSLSPKQEFMQVLQQGRHHARLNKPASAISYLEKALNLAQTHKQPYWQMLASRDGGYIWSKAGRTRAAISAWEQELWASTLLASGIANQHSGLSSEAWQQCKTAIQSVYTRLSQAYENIAEYERRDTYFSLAKQYDDPTTGDKALLKLLKKVQKDPTTSANQSTPSYQSTTDTATEATIPQSLLSGQGVSHEGNQTAEAGEEEDCDASSDEECASKADEGVEAAIGDNWNVCNSLLNRALFYKDKRARRILLTPHSSTNATFLMLAAAKSRLDILRRLLQLKVPRRYMDLEDANGLTALVWGCKFGSSNAVNLLLEAGADVDCCLHGAGQDVLPEDTVASLREWTDTPKNQRGPFRLPGDEIESTAARTRQENSQGEQQSTEGSHLRSPDQRAGPSSSQGKRSNLGQPRELEKWKPEHENLQTLEEYLTLEEEEELKLSLRQPASAQGSGKPIQTTGGLWDGDAEHGALDDTFLTGTVEDNVDEYKDEEGKWDQFAANEALFGVKAGSFDESKYTTPLNIQKFSAAQISEAEKAASEIAAASTVDELRDEDEEQAFASVPR